MSGDFFFATTLCPLQVMSAKFCVESYVVVLVGSVFLLTTDHLDVLSDDWPFGSM